MNTLGPSLVWCAVQVTLFSTVAALVYLAVRRLGPQTGALAALGSLLIVAVLGLLAPSPWPSWTPLLASANSAAPSTDQSLAGESRPPFATFDNAGSDYIGESADTEPTTAEGSPLPLLEWWTTFRDALSPMNEEATTSAQPVTEATGRNWPAVFTFVVLASLAMGLVRTVAGLVAVGHHRRRSRLIADPLLTEQADLLRAELGCQRAVELRESAALPSAATIGWRRPVILLPECWRSWTADERRVVLAHELAHVARGDFVTHLAAQLGLVLHFYHPLVHWLARRLRLEQELAADAAAAHVAGGRHTYLTTLARLALAQPDIRLG